MGKQADLKRAQTGLESRISWFVLVLLTIQPLLDVMSYFLNLQGKTAISTLLRFGLLAVVALVGFLLTKAKKMYLLLFGVVALFWAAHVLNCWRIGYTSFVQDTGNLLRMLNFPIYVMTFLVILQRDPDQRRWFFLGTAIAFGEIVLFTAIPWLTGNPVYTYEQIQVGVLGWFAVPSAQSAILVLTVPLVIYWAYSAKKYWLYLLALILTFGLLYVTGTKLNYYSIFIIAGAYGFLFVLQLGKRCLKYALPMVLILALAVAFRAQSPMMTREDMTRFSQWVYGNMLEDSLENSGADDTVREMIRGGGKEQKEDQDEPVLPPEKSMERMRRALMGIYSDTGVYGVLTSSLNQRFGVYNVMQTYSHTDAQGILSNTRERKLNHAQMMWAEKDTLTHILGFEYSDFLCGKDIFDPENDFPAVFYNMGYLGFALYMGFLGLFFFWVLRGLAGDLSRGVQAARAEGKGKWTALPLGLWQGLRSFLSVELGAVGMSFLLAIIAAQISGNVLRRPNVTIYFAIGAAAVYSLTAWKKGPALGGPRKPKT